MSRSSHGLLIMGRVLLASLFFLGGLNKVLNYGATLEAMTGAGLVPASIFLPLTILLEIGGALLIIFAHSKMRWAALSLAVFTVATNIVFHRFWDIQGPLRQLELSLFFKNIAIAGGLLVLAALPGAASGSPSKSGSA